MDHSHKYHHASLYADRYKVYFEIRFPWETGNEFIKSWENIQKSTTDKYYFKRSFLDKVHYNAIFQN